MRKMPTYRDFKSMKNLPERRVGGLLLLEQRDGTPFALHYSPDVAETYRSALPRREGYWTRARFFPESDPARRVSLAFWLELTSPPRRPSAASEKMAQTLSLATALEQAEQLAREPARAE